MFEKAEIGIPCPECGHETSKTIAWIKAHDEMVCEGPDCGRTIHLERENLLAGLKDAEQSMAKFRKSIGRLGKR